MSDFAPARVRLGWLGESVVLASLAMALTFWIFSRPYTPFTGYDWLELESFNKHFYRAQVLAGELPLWNPYVAFGRPFLADIDTATLYLPNLIFLLPEQWALPVSVAFHFGLMLAGMRIFGRELGLSMGSAMLAGVSFALGAAVSGRLQAGQIQVFCTLAHLPLWWGLGWRLWRAPSRAATVGFAGVTASAIFAGSPPLLWAMSWMLLAWLLAWTAGQPFTAFRQGAVRLGLGAFLGVGLAAVQLLPFFELVLHGNRPLGDSAFASFGALPLRNLWSLFVPSTDALKFFWEMNLFTGVLAPLGFIAAVLLWRDRVTRAFAAVVIVGLLLALEPLGVAGALAKVWPGMGALRLPSRYAFAVGWALVMIVLLWWDRRPRVKGWLASGLAVAQMSSLLWAVDRHAFHYAASTRPEAETPIALQAERLARELGPAPLRVALARDAVRSNLGVRHEFSNLNAFVVPGIARMWDAVHGLAGLSPQPFDPAQTAELALQKRDALAKWGVQFGWDTAAAGFFIDRAASPRARAVFGVERAADAQSALRRWWTTADDPRAPVMLESAKITPPPAERMSVSEEAARPLVITDYRARELEVDWEEAPDGWLVLAEPWFPGWRVRVGETWQETQPANGWMRAVPIEAGTKRVHFKFHSQPFQWGAVVSTGAGLILLGMSAGGLRKNRRVDPRCRLAPA